MTISGQKTDPTIKPIDPLKLKISKDPKELAEPFHEFRSVFISFHRPGKRNDFRCFFDDGRELRGVITPSTYFRWLTRYFSDYYHFKDVPFIVVNGPTDLLERIRLQPEEIKYLQGKTVPIFFYEPIFYFDDSGGWNWHPGKSQSFLVPELDAVKAFQRNHGPDLQVKLMVCDYRLAEALHHRGLYCDLSIETFDTFLIYTAWINKNLLAHFPKLSMDCDSYHLKVKRDSVDQCFIPFSKRMICPNYRYEAVRELVVAYIFGRSYEDECRLSFFHFHNDADFRRGLPFDPTLLRNWEVIQRGIERMQGHLPLTLGCENQVAVSPGSVPLPDWSGGNTRVDSVLQKNILDSCIALVNETRAFTPTGAVSEKTLLPMMLLRPFVVLGSPHILKYIKELGFRTFSDFWDESYDEIENHEERVQAVLKLVDQLFELTWSDLLALYEEMKPVLIHNFLHAYNDFLPSQRKRLSNMELGIRKTRG